MQYTHSHLVLLALLPYKHKIMLLKMQLNILKKKFTRISWVYTWTAACLCYWCLFIHFKFYGLFKEETEKIYHDMLTTTNMSGNITALKGDMSVAYFQNLQVF